MQIANIIGWVLYIIVILFTISWVAYIRMIAKVGGSITYMNLFQGILTLSCVIVFGLLPIPKLNILWIIPVGWIISLTSVGKAIGKIVGIVLSGIGVPLRSALTSEFYVKELVKELEEERDIIRESDDLSDVEIKVEHIYKIQRWNPATFRVSTALASGKVKSNKWNKWSSDNRWYEWGAFFEDHKWFSGQGDLKTSEQMSEKEINRISAAIDNYLNTHFPDGYQLHNKQVNAETDVITCDCPECMKTNNNHEE